MKTRVAIIGSDKWAYQLKRYIEDTDYLSFAGYIDNNIDNGDVICTDEDALSFYGVCFDMVFMGIGYARFDLREKLYELYKSRGIPFAKIIHPTAFIHPTANISDGCLVGPNSVIEMDARLADNVVVHSCVYIAHEVSVDRHCYITARAALAGQAKIGKCCFIGFNCAIRDGVSIANNTIIGCSANVVKDITETGQIYIGNPAKKMIKKL